MVELVEAALAEAATAIAIVGVAVVTLLAVLVPLLLANGRRIESLAADVAESRRDLRDLAGRAASIDAGVQSLDARTARTEKLKSDKHVLYGRQEGRCMGCRELIPIKNMHVDHVVPQSKGGTHHIDNYQLLCNYCNSVKGTGSQEEMRERLKKKGIPAQGGRPYPPTQ